MEDSEFLRGMVVLKSTWVLQLVLEHAKMVLHPYMKCHLNQNLLEVLLVKVVSEPTDALNFQQAKMVLEPLHAAYKQ